MSNPILDNWIFIKGSGDGVVFGEVSNSDNFPDGDIIRTSTVKDLDRDKGILTTQNSVYNLGVEANQDQ